jgi:hypothetical protein
MRWMKLWLLVTLVVCIDASTGSAAMEGRLHLALQWRGINESTGEKDFGYVELANVTGRGLWVAFQKEKGQSFPGIYFNGQFIAASTPIEQMISMELVVTCECADRSVRVKSLLFSKNRPLGTKTATPDNVYHLLVLDDFVQDKDLSVSADAMGLADSKWGEPFWRTHRLAANYTIQSDTKSREFAEVFKVKAAYELPRLILIAEEWMDVPKEVQQKKKKSSGGLFGGALDDIGNEIAGETKVVETKVPIYGVDVLLDELRVEGEYAVGFQAARSVWNDILEGKVIYEATEGERRILTAAVVFSQMEKNRADGKSDNNVLAIDAKSLERLEKCEQLWPSAKEAIKTFIQENPDWKVVIPEKPVTFCEDDQPVYAMYAWFQIHPASGRMVGVLPNSAHGAFSDEMAQLEGTLLEKTKEKIGARGGPVKVLFSQVAGMYVSSAGVLDGVSLTICNPELANLDDQEWRKFLTSHALNFCQKFLEDNAGMYDSYETQLGFWQGAMLITAELGGKDAARDCAARALAGVVDKAIDDTKKHFENKVKGAKQDLQADTRGAFDEAMGQYAPKVKQFVDGVETAKDYYDKGVETYNAVDEYKKRAQTLRDQWEARGQ